MASGRSGKRGKGGAGRGGAGKGQARTRERERLLADAARVELPRHADVCVIGGGAAGLVAAIAAREAGARVVVLERDLACGRTILATGNGRCNFCNVALEPEHYNHPDLAAAVMGEPAEALEDVLGFFRDCGLAWAEEDGRLYPRSRQAASVRNVLLARCWRDGVTLAPAREVLGAARRHGRWYVRFSERWGAGAEGLMPVEVGGATRALSCGSLVLASGGGTNALAGSLGLPLVAESPVLCAVAANGISGIVSFDVSRVCRPGDMMELDLAPEVDAWEVDHLVASRPGDTAALDGILDPVIAAELIGLAGGIGMGGLAWRVAPLVKSLPFRVTGLAETDRAQVTRGGVDVMAVDAATLSLAGRPCLHACGETLDMDGACGGFNLAWAWTSGLRAGEAAARE